MKNPGKQRCSFDFENNTYTGYIVSSTDIEPHFHWFMFEDPEVIARYGDSIAFKIENGELVALYHLTTPLFVKAVEECLRQHLISSTGAEKPQ